MSDYKRFVSYLYEYINDKKTENRGFVRVELRSGICRMEFQLKVFSLPERTQIQVNGFISSDGNMTGFLLGGLFSSKNGITGTLSFPARIAGTAYNVADFNGLLLVGPDNRYYGTQWDETPITPSRFSVYREPSENSKISPGVMETPTLNSTVEITEPETPAPQTAEPEIAEPKPAIPQTAMPETAVPETGPSQLPEQNTPQSEINPVKAPCTLVSQEENAPDSPQEDDSIQTLHIASAEPARRPDPWSMIQKTFPAAAPFDDDELTECVQISIRDLPTLRNMGLPVGCNQFIHHGFQNFQHLMLGRLTSSQRPVYIIGVPGIYNANEQFMAGMFGFSCFKPGHLIKGGRSAEKTGYWYRTIN